MNHGRLSQYLQGCFAFVCAVRADDRYYYLYMRPTTGLGIELGMNFFLLSSRLMYRWWDVADA